MTTTTKLIAKSSIDIDLIVDETINDPHSWEISEIAIRHHLSYWTVYRALKGKPGWLTFGRTVRISNALYRWYIKQAVMQGLSREGVVFPIAA